MCWNRRIVKRPKPWRQPSGDGKIPVTMTTMTMVDHRGVPPNCSVWPTCKPNAPHCKPNGRRSAKTTPRPWRIWSTNCSSPCKPRTAGRTIFSTASLIWSRNVVWIANKWTSCSVSVVILIVRLFVTAFSFVCFVVVVLLLLSRG